MLGATAHKVLFCLLRMGGIERGHITVKKTHQLKYKVNDNIPDKVPVFIRSW